MMKRVLITIIVSCALAISTNAQTMHSILFTNMEEQGRQADRTAELQQMTEFCNTIAESLGYAHDLRRHSGSEFTSVMLEREIASLRVADGDIVLLYYAGHGCNWDDDDWPHMALLDKQYWESTAYSKLKAVSGNAKLTLCISSCCNMDSEGRRKERGYGKYSSIDAEKVRKLFTGFSGRRAIIASSSIRGQYSYSWSSGSTLGSIYTISLRKTITEAVSGESDTELTWEGIFEATKKQTLAYTEGKQLPQYKIENNQQAQVATQPKVVQQNAGSATFENVWVEHNKVLNGVTCMAIHAKFKTHYMNEQGGRLVAFFDSPKGTGLPDTNGLYKSSNGTVCVSTHFGSHYEHSLFADKELVIPNTEIHSKQGENTYYIRLFIYDYKQNKYIAHSDFIAFTME